MISIKTISTYLNQGTRPAQEDHLLNHKERGIIVVADGFGGPVAGSKAAQIACESVSRFLVKEAGDLEATLPFVLRTYFSLAGNVLFNALIYANRSVIKLNKGKDVHEKGGASVIAGFIDGDLLAVANVGACSASLFRAGNVAELVVPRTYGKLLDPFATDGQVEDELAAPLMAMGMADDLEPEIFEYRVKAGDWLLFHTDGIKADIKERLRALHESVFDPVEASQRALEVLQGADYQDNAAVSLVVL